MDDMDSGWFAETFCMGEGAARELAESWERRARSAFLTAQRYERGSIERRFCEHGAMCYFNCASELRAAALIEQPGIPPSCVFEVPGEGKG